MEVYCTQEITRHGELPREKVVKLPRKLASWNPIKIYSCSMCKHKLQCVIDPGCKATFEKT